MPPGGRDCWLPHDFGCWTLLAARWWSGVDNNNNNDGDDDGDDDDDDGDDGDDDGDDDDDDRDDDKYGVGDVYGVMEMVKVTVTVMKKMTNNTNMISMAKAESRKMTHRFMTVKMTSKQ